MDTSNYAFWITYKTDNRTLSRKLLAFHQQNLQLINQLDIKNYSDSINKILIIGIAYHPETTIPEENHIRFIKKQKKVEIYWNLDYEILLSADENQTLTLIFEAYLKATEHFLSQQQDFDTLQFYSDLENIFREAGYLETVETSSDL